jgi:glycosyltransferase involved in cell wall biosynthesis
VEPIVTIYIPTRNRLALLQKALNSCLRQTVRELEIFIVDDASEDGTLEYIQSMRNKDPRITYARNETPLGAPTARNLALTKAAGTYVTGLDDDDYFVEDRIEKLLRLHQESQAASVASQDYCIRRQGDLPRVRLWKPEVISLDDLKYYNCLGNQVLASKELFQNLGGFDPSLTSAQDYDLWIRLVRAYGPVHIVQEPLQVILLTNSHPRIGNSSTKYTGYEAFLQKHNAWSSQDAQLVQRFLMLPSDSAGDSVRAIVAAFRSGAPYHVHREILRRMMSQNIRRLASIRSIPTACRS